MHSCGEEGPQLVQPVVEMLNAAPWPAPLLLPPLLPLLPLPALAASQRSSVLQQILRLDDQAFANYPSLPPGERSIARRMLQVLGLPGA